MIDALSSCVRRYPLRASGGGVDKAVTVSVIDTLESARGSRLGPRGHHVNDSFTSFVRFPVQGYLDQLLPSVVTFAEMQMAAQSLYHGARVARPP